MSINHKPPSCAILSSISVARLTADQRSALQAKMDEIITYLIRSGYRDFIVDLDRGPSLWVASRIAQDMPDNPDLKLLASIPFANQGNRWSVSERRCYTTAKQSAIIQNDPAQDYSPECIQENQRKMVMQSDHVLAITEAVRLGSPSSYASWNGRTITHLNPFTLEVKEIPPVIP